MTVRLSQIQGHGPTMHELRAQPERYPGYDMDAKHELYAHIMAAYGAAIRAMLASRRRHRRRRPNYLMRRPGGHG